MASEENLQSTASDKVKCVTICGDNQTKIINKKSSKAIMVSSLIKNSETQIDSSLATSNSLEKLTSLKNSQVPAISNSSVSANATNTANKNTINNPTSGSKMGSRRIFTPQFKLQVLESYRSDSDCKGNQRATARKYNIHRRQIQKWLQCESNLRSSVANINHSTIEHQFHNINHLQHLQHHHHHHHHQQQQLDISTASSVTSSHYNHNHIFNNHQQTHTEQLPLPLDTTVQNTDYMTALSPPLTNASTLSSKGMLTAGNFTNMVMTTGDSMPLSNPLDPTMTFAMSPLRQTAIGRNDSTANSTSPYLYQHQQYPIPYSGSSTIASVSVPILADYTSPHHQYQNTNNNCSHASLILQQPSTVLSTGLTGTALSYAATEVVSRREIQNERNKRCYQVCTLKSLPISEYNNKHYIFSKNISNGTNRLTEELYESDSQNKSFEQNLSITPIDLSVGSRRKEYVNISKHNHGLPPDPLQSQPSTISKKEIRGIDLTYRKRKFITTNSESSAKTQKIEQFTNVSSKETYQGCDDKNHIELERNEDDTSEDVEIDVVERTPPPKPVKLFKPYLLDDEEDNRETKASSTQIYENGQIPTVWSHQTSGASPNICEENHKDFYTNQSFQSGLPPTPDRQEFPMRNTNMSRGDNTPCLQPVSAEYSVRGFPCPKGSPVSGYESSSSIYSDSSSGADSMENTYINNRAYSIDLKLHPINNENLLTNKIHIEKWLDRDINKIATVANSSNVLYI